MANIQDVVKHISKSLETEPADLVLEMTDKLIAEQRKEFEDKHKHSFKKLSEEELKELNTCQQRVANLRGYL